MVLMAIFNEAGCGANFALVPHCNPCERISATSFDIGWLTSTATTQTPTE
jgi:hypothetical protein